MLRSVITDKYINTIQINMCICGVIHYRNILFSNLLEYTTTGTNITSYSYEIIQTEACYLQLNEKKHTC